MPEDQLSREPIKEFFFLLREMSFCCLVADDIAVGRDGRKKKKDMARGSLFSSLSDCSSRNR